jgi:dTDP-4-dehydrorhamnose reductase
MRLLVAGAGGMLGRDVVGIATADGHDVLAYARADLDVTDAPQVVDVIGAARPDAVINCAAWTDVDGAESAAEAALRVNGTGAGNVARAAADCGAWSVHVSTDYVFDGLKTTPYVESDPVAPMSQYGIGKLAGERAVAAQAPIAHTIVRTSWLFGAGGPCFPKAIIRAAGERDELTVVDDQIGCPTFTGHLAGALIALASARIPGVLHAAGAGHCSWNEFAKEIVTSAGLTTPVLPGRTADLGRPAPRPAYSVLVSERCSEGAPVLPHWREGLAAFIDSGVLT